MKKWVALLLLRGTQRDLQSAAPPPRTAPRGPVLRVLAFFIAGQHSGGAWGGYLLDSWLACSYGDRVAPGLTRGLGRTPWRWLLGWRRGGSFPGSRVAGVPWRCVLGHLWGEFLGLMATIARAGVAGRKTSPVLAWRDLERYGRPLPSIAVVTASAAGGGLHRRAVATSQAHRSGGVNSRPRFDSSGSL